MFGMLEYAPGQDQEEEEEEEKEEEDVSGKAAGGGWKVDFQVRQVKAGTTGAFLQFFAFTFIICLIRLLNMRNGHSQ